MKLLCLLQNLAFVLGVVTLTAAVASGIAGEPAQVVTDVFYSITGFCIGFLYATWLYAGKLGR